VTLERVGATPADGRFRSADARGEVAWPAIGEPTEYVHVIEFATPGVRRGFHRHTRHRERVYLFRGALSVRARLGAGPAVELTLAAGDLVSFAENVSHGFVSLEPSLAVALGTGSNPMDDTVADPGLD
jgi:quercetin dioxygenase-like cupin family protein